MTISTDTAEKFLAGTHRWNREAQFVLEHASPGVRDRFIRSHAIEVTKESGTALGIPFNGDTADTSTAELVAQACEIYQEPLLDEHAAMREAGVPVRPDDADARRMRESEPLDRDQVADMLALRESGIPLRSAVLSAVQLREATAEEALAEAGVPVRNPQSHPDAELR